MSRIRIVIPRLVLDGVSPQQRPAIEAALRLELASRIAAGAAPTKAAPGNVANADPTVLTVSSEAPAEIGRTLARHVNGRIAR